MKIVYAILLAACVLVTASFTSCVPEPSGSPGFPVDSDYVIVDSEGNVLGGGPVPGQAMSGIWLSDNSGAVGSVYSFNSLTNADGTFFVANGRINANWSSQIIWNPPCVEQTSGSGFFTVDAFGFGFTCVITVEQESPNSSTHFALPTTIPSTLTSYGDFSTTYGDPGLRVYVGTPTPSLVSTISASSVVSGSSATFPFSKQSNGSPLGQGFYALVNTNVASGGKTVWADSSYLAVGGSTTLSSAFGVDAADIKYITTACTTKGCSTIKSQTAPAPILTQYYANSVVSYTGATIPVGTEPVAVKGYGSVQTERSNGSLHYFTTGPAHAIVANSGSSSVSIVSFATNTDVANIAVGAQPMALILNSTNTMAYVASYGNGTLAEINLSTNAVTRTVSGLAGAESVAMDPSGSYVWVGGTDHLYKVSLSTFAVVSSVSVSGSVTSLATSSARNELVYTLVQNCCTSSSSYVANELLLSNLSKPGAYAQSAATAFAPYTMNGTLPSAAVLPQATTVVSARFSNGMGASSTPTGFVIYDLVSHKQIMTGTTPTPVRGIATDPDCMFAYFTLPDSNEYISVPLESTP